MSVDGVLCLHYSTTPFVCQWFYLPIIHLIREKSGFFRFIYTSYIFSRVYARIILHFWIFWLFYLSVVVNLNLQNGLCIFVHFCTSALHYVPKYRNRLCAKKRRLCKTALLRERLCYDKSINLLLEAQYAKTQTKRIYFC